MVSEFSAVNRESSKTYLLLDHSASDINGLIHTSLALPEPMKFISTHRNIIQSPLTSLQAFRDLGWKSVGPPPPKLGG
jgi:hypothetical protein